MGACYTTFNSSENILQVRPRRNRWKYIRGATPGVGHIRGATPGVGRIRQSLIKHKPNCMISSKFRKSKTIPGFKS